MVDSSSQFLEKKPTHTVTPNTLQFQSSENTQIGCIQFNSTQTINNSEVSEKFLKRKKNY